MAYFNETQLTLLGKDLFAKAQTGTVLNITKVTVGDGVWAPELDPETLTALVNEKEECSIIHNEFMQAGLVQLRFRLKSEDTTEDFYIREIGVWAYDPDLDQDILYCVTNTETPDWMPAQGGDTIIDDIIDINTTIGNAENVTVEITDPSGQIASQGDLADEVSSRQNADNNLQTNIDAEATTRQNADNNHAAENITGANAVHGIRQGSGNALDADTVDTKHFSDIQNDAQTKVDTHSAENITAANTVHGIRQGSGNALDSDTVDGFHASVLLNRRQFTIDDNSANINQGDIVRFVNEKIYKGDATTYGSEYVFNSNSTQDTNVSMLDATHFVVTYRDAGNNDYGTAIIGTVNGDVITYGNEYVFHFGGTYYISVSMLDATHFVVTYEDGANSQGKAIIGTVNGDVITYGSSYIFNPLGTSNISVSMLDATHFVVTYRDGNNSNYGTAIIGTVNVDVITYGNEYVFNSGTTDHISVSMLDATHFVVVYRDASNSNNGTAIIGTVSGVITYGNEYVFNSDNTTYISVSMLNATHFIVTYRRGNSYGTAIIGIVTGDVITYGSEYVFNSGTTDYTSVNMFDATQFVVTYRDVGNSNYGTAIIGTVTGDVITYENEYVFNSGNTDYISVNMFDVNHFIVTYRDIGNNDYGTAIIFNKSNILGIAYSAGNPGAVIDVIMYGIADVYNNLTIGVTYYIQNDLTVGTTRTPLPLGYAISSTELITWLDNIQRII